uniref:Uncharacterized protein n=1 Tax=Oryza sativa subsp. japonica TaxID=39947 RepID=Q8H2S5_ORYSJ|nr:hypothetical protein [Oryza sativa Japonica Group]BAD30811.1 hypothetical protein [Oryza sativa Japonica Group]
MATATGGEEDGGRSPHLLRHCLGFLKGFEEDFKENIGRNDDENPTAALGARSGATMVRSAFPTIRCTKWDET